MEDVFLYDVKAYMAWFRSSCSCELIPHMQVTLCLRYFPVHDLLALSIQSIAKVSFAIQDTHIYSSLAILDAILYFTKQHEILNLFLTSICFYHCISNFRTCYSA